MLEDKLYQAHRNLLCAIFNQAILDLKRENLIYHDALFFLQSNEAKEIISWIDCLNGAILDKIVNDVNYRELVIRRLNV